MPGRLSDPRGYGEEYDSGVESIRRHGSRPITYSPDTKSCVDLKKQSDRDSFFERYAHGGQPVYLISVTNNSGDFDESIKETYVQLRYEGASAMLGQRTDIDGATYRDVTRAVSGISLEQALKYKRKCYQSFIVVIEKNGPPRLI